MEKNGEARRLSVIHSSKIISVKFYPQSNLPPRPNNLEDWIKLKQKGYISKSAPLLTIIRYVFSFRINHSPNQKHIAA